MAGLFRSLLFVPGNNPRFLEKSKQLQVDMICFDLEDSVPDSEKKNARTLIKDALKERDQYSSDVYVRINSPESGKIEDDLEKILQKGLDGIVIPKVNSAKELSKITKILTRLEKKRKVKQVPILPSIESAQGVVNAYEIASSKRVSAIVFGVFDLLNDMGVEYTKQAPGAQYARSKIPVDATAAGVYAIDAIWQDLQDTDGLKNDCEIGRSLGYVGKSIIHPSQVSVAHEIFAPNQAEVEWAKKVCDTYNESVNKGKGATVVDGRMIDEVHFKRAKSLLEIAKK
ncbi:MAG TPA: CoA ester lyase [Candidatus Nitrosotenuis sp.]|nr:CoA ester lyase [Candidatus Nitrosotenuis sp.]